ncbi:hypothetical protein BDR03DRAFT_728445 [Suillus americanus]|nr:hypothetical protein BDR03DRAFT_728445 [Suillus americanus]
MGSTRSAKPRGSPSPRERARRTRNRVQDFCRWLVEKGLIDEDDASHFPSDSLHCPACSEKQTSCNMCKLISCSNSDCEVSSAIPIVQCSNHHNTRFCTSCLERPLVGHLPRLARPLSCQSTTCMDNSRESGKSGRRCCNTRCWSRVGTATCPDCITQESFACPCGQYWTCGGCESQASSASRTLTCPGCHRRFCLSCSYIEACDLCDHVELCRDCIKDGKSIEEERTMSECESCGSLLCETCADIDEKLCCKCNQSTCKLCAREGDDNGDYPDIVCEECRASIENMAYGDYI